MLGQLKAATSHKPNRRIVATAVAALLLLAQLIAAAHVHPDAYRRLIVNGAKVNLAEGACPVCLLHFHSPSTTNPIPSLACPVLSDDIVVATASSRLHCFAKTELFGRAPPAAV